MVYSTTLVSSRTLLFSQCRVYENTFNVVRNEIRYFSIKYKVLIKNYLRGHRCTSVLRINFPLVYRLQKRYHMLMLGSWR